MDILSDAKQNVVNNFRDAIVQLNGGRFIFTEHELNVVFTEVAAIIIACPDDILEKALSELEDGVQKKERC